MSTESQTVIKNKVTDRPPQRLQTRLILRRYGTLIGFLIVVIAFWIARPTTFLTAANLLNIGQQVSNLAVVAFAMTIVMALGDFDLSVGAMASLAGVTAAVLLRSGVPIPVVVAAALGVGAIGGLLNGTIIAYFRVLPFIGTLGTMTVFSGLAFELSDGKTIFGKQIPAEVSTFAKTGALSIFGVSIPNLTLVALIVLFIVWIVLEQTTFGRRLYAIGGNKEAARLGGVRVKLLRACAFIVCGVGAALAGVMSVSRLGSSNPTQGDGYMLDAIAAVFLGMTLSEEGEPHVLGTLLGVLILGVLGNGLTQLAVDSYRQQILTGAIIVGAVMISSLSRRE